MSEIIAFVWILYNMIEKLKNTIDRYMKKRKFRDMALNVLRDDDEKYMSLCNEMYKAVDDLFSNAQFVKVNVSAQQCGSIIVKLTRMVDLSSDLIQTFISLVKNCSYISKNEGFMGYLKESDVAIYDFIGRMNDIYIESDGIRIDGGFFTYFKLYEGKIRKVLTKKELEALEKNHQREERRY